MRPLEKAILIAAIAAIALVFYTEIRAARNEITGYRGLHVPANAPANDPAQDGRHG